MKIQSIRRRQGVTLLEMTIVIMIIIALISVLFIGFKMYRDGANKANCLIVLSSAQKEVRAHQALNNGLDGGALKAGMTFKELPTIKKANAAGGCPGGAGTGGDAAYTNGTGGNYPTTTDGVEQAFATCAGSESGTHNDAFATSLGSTAKK